MTKGWQPSESDLEWIEQVVGMLKVGGKWGSSFGIYVRTGANEVTLVAVNKEYPSWKENVERTEKAIKMCGYDYENKSEG